MAGIALTSGAFDLYLEESFLSSAAVARLLAAAHSLLEIFVFSLSCEEIRAAVEQVSSKIYESNWYEVEDGSNEVRRLLLIALQPKITNVEFKALGFMSLSNETFVSVSSANI